MHSRRYARHRWLERLDDLREGAGVEIATRDTQAYLLYPRFRWVFNKLEICRVQGIPAYPHGIAPAVVGVPLPVFSKPIINLHGLSAGARLLTEWHEDEYVPGHFWMPVLEGRQLSVDCVVSDGRIHWSYAMEPQLDAEGSFQSWTTVETLPTDVEQLLADWVATHLADHAGVVNFETIGAAVLEAPPRLASQFLDFYGEDWLDRVVDLYVTGRWREPTPGIAGVSYVVRVPRSYEASTPRVADNDALDAAETETQSAIYLPWFDGLPFRYVTHDGRSYRLAFVNARTFAAAEDAGEAVKRIVQISHPDMSGRHPPPARRTE